MEMGCQGDLVTWEEMQQPLVLRPGRVVGSSPNLLAEGQCARLIDDFRRPYQPLVATNSANAAMFIACAASI